MHTNGAGSLSIEGKQGATITSIPQDRKLIVLPIHENELDMIASQTAITTYSWSACSALISFFTAILLQIAFTDTQEYNAVVWGLVLILPFLLVSAIICGAIALNTNKKKNIHIQRIKDECSKSTANLKPNL